MTELRKEWREMLDRAMHAGWTMTELTFELQALADKERREAFEAGMRQSPNDDEWISLCDTNNEGEYIRLAFTQYLKSQEEV